MDGWAIWVVGGAAGAVKSNERDAYGEGLNTGAVRSSLVSIASGMTGVADGASPEEDATMVASVDTVDWVGGRAALRAAADFGGMVLGTLSFRRSSFLFQSLLFHLSFDY